MQEKLTCTSATKEVEQVLFCLSQMLQEIHQTFMKNLLSLKYKQRKVKLGNQTRQSIVGFFQTGIKLSPGEALTVQATTTNLSKIYYDLLRIEAQVEKKVSSKTKFSTAAVRETNELLRRTVSLFPHVADAIRTCSPVIILYVQKETAALRELAANSIAVHERRLCEAKCHPRACVLYMQILQHLQDILWHLEAMVCNKNFLTYHN